MTFRARLTISAAVAVAISIALASLTAYVVVRGDLQDQIDSSLRDRAFNLRHGHQTTVHDPTIKQDRTSATLALATTFLRAC